MMKKLIKHGFKGFGEPPSASLKQKKNKKPLFLRQQTEQKTISQTLRQVEIKTEKNRLKPEAYSNFVELLNEGNEEKLIAYFSQYGILPSVAKLNLKALVSEELSDLSS